MRSIRFLSLALLLAIAAGAVCAWRFGVFATSLAPEVAVPVAMAPPGRAVQIAEEAEPGDVGPLDRKSLQFFLKKIRNHHSGELPDSWTGTLVKRFAESETPLWAYECEQNHDPDVRDLVKTMETTGDEIVPALLELLRNDNRHLRAFAAWSITRIGAKNAGTLQAMAEGLNDSYSVVRVWSMKALGRAGPNAKASVPSLVRCFADPEIGWVASETVGKIGPSQFSLLLDLMEDPNPAIRKEAMFAIHTMRNDAVPDLTKALTDPNPNIRMTCANTLGAVGAKAKPALPALRALLRDPVEMVRGYAEKAIHKIDR